MKKSSVVEPIAPKLPYPDDDNRGTKAAKRRRLTDIKDQARGCLALYDVQAEIKKEIREMEEMKENCWAKICESEEHFEKLCKATVADFFPGGKYGPKDPDDEVEEYDTEELKEEPVDTPLLKFTEEENKMLDVNVLACMRGWQKEGEILDAKAKLPMKKVDVDGNDVVIISSGEEEYVRQSTYASEHKDPLTCIACEGSLTEDNTSCLRNHALVLNYKRDNRKPEKPGFLPGVMTPLHRCTPECKGKVHLQ